MEFGIHHCEFFDELIIGINTFINEGAEAQLASRVVLTFWERGFLLVFYYSHLSFLFVLSPPCLRLEPVHRRCEMACGERLK